MSLPNSEFSPEDKLKKNILWWAAGLLITGFGAGYGVSDHLNTKSKEGFDLVPQKTYTLNTEIDKEYVSKEEYAIIKSKLTNQTDSVENSADPASTRKIEVIKGTKDYKDVFGILVCTSSKLSEPLYTYREKLKNSGFHNTEIFYTNKKNFCLIVYGYENIGVGIKRNIAKVKKIVREHANIIDYVDLTTLASEGFIEYRERTMIQYYIPIGEGGPQT